MTVGATRHFESSFSIVEWMLEERQDELDDHEIAALKVYHDVLCRTSEDLWGYQPPKLPQKCGDVPLHPDLDEDYFRRNY